MNNNEFLESRGETNLQLRNIAVCAIFSKIVGRGVVIHIYMLQLYIFTLGSLYNFVIYKRTTEVVGITYKLEVTHLMHIAL